MRKFIINGMNIGYVAPNRSIDVSYDNTESGLSSTTVQDALDELGGGVNSLNENKVDKEEGKGLFSGSYNDLSNKPTIPVVPTNVSAFNNDSGYITGINKTMVTDALGYTPPTTNTTYSGSSTVTLSGTTFSLTKANVTTALGYTPPTSDTNTVTSFTTKTFEFNVSIAAGGDGVYTPTITNSGWTPLGVVGVYAGNIILCPFRWGLVSSTQARIDIHNYYSATSTSKASVTILYYKNS